MTSDIALERIADARRTILQLLARRTDQATICPSEVARMIAGKVSADPEGPSWRQVMPFIHAAIDQLVAEGVVELSWKRKVMASRYGPYRIGRIQSTR
ncbi:DUF3253 domain-containing protein [Sphingobium yanoikuyae]|jgi:hypothetical protein|uniref:DUF3253 domain-containing protein n=1 Tax=Sphingobium yanoikuyae TaxID=13690 RepID=A0A0J9FIJ7_SPHYA|nr:DUF3253 domain-containing protein [Sphingobium yanoikuyae]ATP20274.1 DUF3253 domain-containing protein [Sphingobium yanoikuyae]KMW28370.1 hypothetical protein BV87_22070 [Sphingobium yanoikuyae]